MYSFLLKKLLVSFMMASTCLKPDNSTVTQTNGGNATTGQTSLNLFHFAKTAEDVLAIASKVDQVRGNASSVQVISIFKKLPCSAFFNEHTKMYEIPQLVTARQMVICRDAHMSEPAYSMIVKKSSEETFVIRLARDQQFPPPNATHLTFKDILSDPEEVIAPFAEEQFACGQCDIIDPEAPIKKSCQEWVQDTYEYRKLAWDCDCLEVERNWLDTWSKTEVVLFIAGAIVLFAFCFCVNIYCMVMILGQHHERLAHHSNLRHELRSLFPHLHRVHDAGPVGSRADSSSNMFRAKPSTSH